MKHTLLIGLISVIGSVMALAVDPGAVAPSFKGTNVKSEAVSLDSFKGKIVVLEWINFGCPFVKKHYQSGNIPKLQKEFADKEVVWLSINSSAEGKQGYMPADKMAAKAKKEGNAATHFVIDADGEIGRAYGAKVTPHMIIIGKDGKVAYNGAMDSKATTKAADVATAEPLFVNALKAVIAGKEVENAKNKPYGCGVKY